MKYFKAKQHHNVVVSLYFPKNYERNNAQNIVTHQHTLDQVRVQ